MAVIPYIHFDGRCAEALTAYAAIFGSPEPELSRYGDTPGATFDDAGAARVMHGEVMLDGAPLYASDFPPGIPADPQQGMSVTVTMTEVARGAQIHAGLMDGGTEIQPFGETFFSPGFGMLKDRFGTHWIIMTLPAGE